MQASGDPKKRYFLIGPRKNATAPTEGYGLVLIMPGGDGSAEFHAFVKRIYKNAISERYLAVQPIAVKWEPEQQIVWPTKATPVAGMKFSTEEFIESVIADVAKKHKIDPAKVFSLSWSSSGPAAYAASLAEKHSVRGSFIAMSVFKPESLPPLKAAGGHAYYLYHSQQDRVCPYRMAEQARTSLAENGPRSAWRLTRAATAGEETFSAISRPASTGSKRTRRKPPPDERPSEICPRQSLGCASGVIRR